MDRVKRKVAIVTGGASGIGEATAKLLAKEGASIALLDIDDENGKRVEGEIRASGGTVFFWHMNIASEAEVETVFRKVSEKYGKIDILVNNAGIVGAARPPHELSIEEFDSVMDVNLKGTFFCIKHAVPYMLASGGGSVVNVSSTMGMLAGPAAVYNTSKAAVRHMTKCMAIIYADKNIRFNSVHPGYIITPLFTNLVKDKPGGVEAAAERQSKNIPLGRMGLPEDIANGILYLASDEAAYVTGSELVIDGGNMVV